MKPVCATGRHELTNGGAPEIRKLFPQRHGPTDTPDSPSGERRRDETCRCHGRASISPCSRLHFRHGVLPKATNYKSKPCVQASGFAKRTTHSKGSPSIVIHSFVIKRAWCGLAMKPSAAILPKPEKGLARASRGVAMNTLWPRLFTISAKRTD